MALGIVAVITNSPASSANVGSAIAAIVAVSGSLSSIVTVVLLFDPAVPLVTSVIA